jgi:pimeloyl-ACP methyl ester carboxylesterase
MTIKLREHEYLIPHPQGRNLMVKVYGARDFSRVVLYSHGFPASRLEAGLGHECAATLGITIIAMDRPGFGCSDWYRGRRLEDWASDCVAVADHFQVERFDLLGVSGGTPTAVAAAALLPQRVDSLTIVSGVAPVQLPDALAGMNRVNHALLSIARVLPRVSLLCIAILGTMWRVFPSSVRLWFSALLSSPDREIFSRSDVKLMMARNIQEALRNGVRGVLTDFSLLVSDWRGFLPQVRVPTTVWHGDADTYVPFSMGQALAQGIPGSTFEHVPGLGHFMVVAKLRDVFQRLLEKGGS